MMFTPVRIQKSNRTSSAAPDVVLNRVGAEIRPLTEEVRESADFVDTVEAVLFRLNLTRATAVLSLESRLQVVDTSPIAVNGVRPERIYDVKRIEQVDGYVELSAARSR